MSGYDAGDARRDLQRLRSTWSSGPIRPRRLGVRRELGLAAETPLVGLFGRFHVDKDHHDFAKAAGLVHRRLPDVHFLLCGRASPPANRQLGDWLVEQHEIASSIATCSVRAATCHG